jgi:hypothetical protein
MLKDYSVKPHPEGWQQVIDMQNAAYPKCKHGTPTAFIDFDDRPICMRCVEEDPKIRMRFKSTSLVSGGLA